MTNKPWIYLLACIYWYIWMPLRWPIIIAVVILAAKGLYSLMF